MKDTDDVKLAESPADKKYREERARYLKREEWEREFKRASDAQAQRYAAARLLRRS